MKLIATLVLISLISLIAGCDAEKKDNIPVLKINHMMKTHCIGHNLIDLPDGYTLKTGSLGTFIPDQNEVEDGSIDLLVKPATGVAAFEKEVNERYAHLAGSEDMASHLSQAKDIDGTGKMFRVQIIDGAYKSEIHWLLHDKYLIATMKSYNNQVQHAENVLLNFMRNVEYQSTSTDVPTSFCLDGVLVKGRYRSESASLYFTSVAMPDITFTANVNTYQKDSAETLLQRVGGPDSLLRKFDAKESVLRKGELKVAGMRAQEWVASILLGENRSEKQVDFTLETLRPLPAPSDPKIHLEMEVKGSSAHDERSTLALWDSITRSLRQR